MGRIHYQVQIIKVTPEPDALWVNQAINRHKVMKWCPQCHNSKAQLFDDTQDHEEETEEEYWLYERRGYKQKYKFKDKDNNIDIQTQHYVHETIKKQLLNRRIKRNIHPLSIYSRSIHSPHLVEDIASIIFLQYTGSHHQQHQPSEEKENISNTLIDPSIAGIHPQFLDPRIITATLNRIRVIAQCTTDMLILTSMNIQQERIEQIIAGAPFKEYEIINNLAYISFLANQTISGIYSAIQTCINQCFHGTRLYEMILPIPHQFFAPQKFDDDPPEQIIKQIINRRKNIEIQQAIPSAMYHRAAVCEGAMNMNIRQLRATIISNCKANNYGYTQLRQIGPKPAILYQEEEEEEDKNKKKKKKKEEIRNIYNELKQVQQNYTPSNLVDMVRRERQTIQIITGEEQKGAEYGILESNGQSISGKAFEVGSGAYIKTHSINTKNSSKQIKQQANSQVSIPLFYCFLHSNFRLANKEHEYQLIQPSLNRKEEQQIIKEYVNWINQLEKEYNEYKPTQQELKIQQKQFQYTPAIDKKQQDKKEEEQEEKEKEEQGEAKDKQQQQEEEEEENGEQKEVDMDLKKKMKQKEKNEKKKMKKNKLKEKIIYAPQTFIKNPFNYSQHDMHIVNGITRPATEP
ncbi:MAG: hypothetical protein EZS28_018447 [Streblomastix strix]|uniref:Uncharacterized protein n=1 Tax=Streblomastix strix TaxID=222440 RepID=A0A5J4VTX6_9EUKA|nr:MAG: hypothetical protein EZS28_018447 [Streblomastix strix]